MEHFDLSQGTNDKHFRERSIVDESDEVCYMVQENDSLEVTSETHLDDCTSTSNDDYDSMNAHILI